MIKTCIFPVAGLGTRFLPATKSIPKEMLTVIDKPLIQYAVEEAKEAGVERFIFVTSQGKSAIEDHFDTNELLEKKLKEREEEDLLRLIYDINLRNGEAIYIRQAEPLGLGHAIYCARHFVHGKFFSVILADDLIDMPNGCLKNMLEHYQEGTQMIAVENVGYNHIHRYGCVNKQSHEIIEQVTQIVEKPKKEEAYSPYGVIGRYILPYEIFNTLKTKIQVQKKEIQITDSIFDINKTHPLYTYTIDGKRYDCGNKVGWLKANISYALKTPSLSHEIKVFLKQIINN